MKKDNKWKENWSDALVIFLRLLQHALGQWTHDQLNTRWKQKSEDISLSKRDSLLAGFLFKIWIMILELPCNFARCLIIKQDNITPDNVPLILEMSLWRWRNDAEVARLNC
jgi:hypothetical protein